MLSGFQVSTSPEPKFSKFDAFATAMGCTQSLSSLRLQCLRNVSASTIRNYTNGPDSGQFSSYVIDKYAFFFSVQEVVLMFVASVTAFADPLERIRTGQIAQVPILLGNAQDDGTIFAYNSTKSLSTFLEDMFGSYADLVPPNLVRALYPGLDDLHVIYAVERDMHFRWCVHLLV